jgi:hypothetical protein
MTNSRPARVGATSHPAAPAVDLGVDVTSLSVDDPNALKHRVEEELAAVEPAEPVTATTGEVREHHAVGSDPQRAHGLRQLLIRVDEAMMTRRDTAEQPTGE